MNKGMSREELINHVWDICMRVGMMEGLELYTLRHGDTKNPSILPPKLIMLINKNFDNLYEVNYFFAPINKRKNYQKFTQMLNEIAPFRESDIIFEGALFTLISKKIEPITVNEYEG